MSKHLSSRLVATPWLRPVWAASTAFALMVALSLTVAYRESSKPFGFEAEWAERIVEHRSPFWTTIAMLFDALGGGLLSLVVVPVGIAALLVLARRRWAAVYFLVASILTGLLVQAVKHAIGRPRPLDILVSADYGSFPSGHAANAAITAVALGLIVRRWWMWTVGALYTLAMMVSRTYLGAHWLSDTLGGVLIAVGVAIALWGLFAARLKLERQQDPAPVWSRAESAAA